MTDTVLPLDIKLFGGFELRARGKLIDNLHLRDADKLLTLLICWDFIADRAGFDQNGFEMERRARYADLRAHFEQDLSQAMKRLRVALPAELRERFKDTEAKGFARFVVDHSEVDVIRLWDAVKADDVAAMKQGVRCYQPLLPIAWLPLDHRSDDLTGGASTLGRTGRKEKWMGDIRRRMQALHIEALMRLTAPDLPDVDIMERKKFLDILSEEASDKATRIQAMKDLRALEQAQALQTDPDTRLIGPVIAPPPVAEANAALEASGASEASALSDTSFLPVIPPAAQVVSGGNNLVPPLPFTTADNGLAAQPKNPIFTRKPAGEVIDAAGGEPYAATEAEFERVFALAKAANDAFNGPDHVNAMNRLEQESAAIHAVLDWCGADASRHHNALRLAEKVWEFWYIRGPWKEARQRLDHIVALPGCQQPTLERAYTLIGAAVFALANAALSRAEGHLNESRHINEQIGSPDVTGGVYNTLGWYACVGKSPDIPKAMQCYEQSLQAFTQAENHAACLWPLRGMGECRHVLGDRHRARDFYTQARKVGKAYRNARGMAFVCTDFARLERQEEDFNNAQKECVEGLHLWQQVAEWHSFASCLESVADFAKAIACLGEAATLYGAARTIRDNIQIPNWMYETRRLDAEISALAGSLAGDFDAVWQQGVDMADDSDRIIAFVSGLSI